MAVKYQWKAIKQDNSEMDQFTGPTENLFAGVMTELGSDNIKEFQIIEQEDATPNAYCVDLNNYKFYKGSSTQKHLNDITPAGITSTGVAKLIFKRRNDVRVDEFGHPVDPPRATYVLGFQTSNGKKYAMYVRAAVGQLPEEVVDPAEVQNERAW